MRAAWRTHGAAERGVPEDAARRIFEKFSGHYMFPESHAFAFGVTAYHMAWLKHYYPLEFYAALFNQQPMGFYNLETLKEMGAISRRANSANTKFAPHRNTKTERSEWCDHAVWLATSVDLASATSERVMRTTTGDKGSGRSDAAVCDESGG